MDHSPKNFGMPWPLVSIERIPLPVSQKLFQYIEILPAA